MKRIFDFFANFYRRFVLKRIIKKMTSCIRDEFLDNFLELLLKMVKIALLVDKDFRRNIEGFNARYSFKSRDGQIAASAIFKNNKMKVRKKEIPDTNITVIFKDGKSLWEFLFTGDPDIFRFVLENKLSYVGNLNYILKFGYMVNHLRLKFSL